jgi:hypothetical protein
MLQEKALCEKTSFKEIDDVTKTVPKILSDTAACALKTTISVSTG